MRSADSHNLSVCHSGPAWTAQYHNVERVGYAVVVRQTVMHEPFFGEATNRQSRLTQESGYGKVPLGTTLRNSLALEMYYCRLWRACAGDPQERAV